MAVKMIRFPCIREVAVTKTGKRERKNLDSTLELRKEKDTCETTLSSSCLNEMELDYV